MLIIKTFYYLFYKETNRHCDNKSKIFVDFHSFFYSVDFFNFQIVFFLFESESRALHRISLYQQWHPVNLLELLSGTEVVVDIDVGIVKVRLAIFQMVNNHIYFIFNYELKEIIILICWHVAVTNNIIL